MVGKTLSKISEKKFMLGGAILFAVTSIAYVFAPPFLAFSPRKNLSGNRNGFLFYGLHCIYH
jgi:hypothetical protein